MKLGGLFSGIGGFELAWTQLGHEVAWMCEIDRNARKVLEARFPGVPIYEDVEQLDPTEVEAVDVLTGGSPCQGFSVAGTRSGLEHGESRLFADYIRIMDGLVARGLKWALWENVPGVLSIQNDDGERTFEHVVTALVGGTVPVRLGQGRWNTGLADGGGRAVAWRVLDSRYFGVAQRRRRVFACVAFGGVAADRAGRALLAKSEGVSGDSSSGGPEGEGAAYSTSDSIGVPRVARTLGASGAGTSRTTGNGNMLDFVIPDAPSNAFRMTAFGQYEDDDSASTLKQRDHKDATDLVVSSTVTSKWAKGSGGPAGSETGNLVTQSAWWDGGDTADSLTTTSDAQRMPDKQRLQAVVDTPKMLFVRGGIEVDRHGKKAGKGPLLTDNESATLDSGNHWTLFQSLAPSLTASNDPSRSPQSSEVTRQVAAVHASGYGVRRLTPVECERLQAFPDGWTEPAGSDSARYKALGNAVTVNTVRWVLGRMLDQS